MIEVIKSELDLHKVRYDLSFSDKVTDEIISYVKRGVYAFQLIYDEKNEVTLVKKLDWTKVVQNLDFSHSNITLWLENESRIKIENNVKRALWSYGGGRFQYSSRETLKIDIQKIRDLKLEKIFTH
jgi:hypothetical protein